MMPRGLILAVVLVAGALSSGCAGFGPNACAALFVSAFVPRGSGSSTGGGTTRSVYADRIQACERSCGDPAARCATGCDLDRDPARCHEGCDARYDLCMHDCMPPEPID